jgi:hypothetical protein
MSEELEKGEATEIASDSPLEGTTQSMGDATQPVDQDALDEQTLASDGVIEPADTAEDTTEYADTPDPIANEVSPQDSFWSGFFGAPSIPTVGRGE